MATRQKGTRRPNYQLVLIPGTSKQLVLGIRWQTVLGEDLQKEALRLARLARATHYVQSDARSPSVGLLVARGRESRAKTRTSLYSAAAAFAQKHRHGAHVVACTLADQTVWYAAVVDGVVQAGGDVIFLDVAKASETLADARSRYRDLQLHSNYLADSSPFSLQQLTAHVNPQSALRRATFKLSMVSPWWWVLLGLVASYEAWDIGTSWWEARQARLHAEMQAQQPELDAAALWTRAIGAWASTVKTLGEPGTLGESNIAALLDQLAQVPVEPGRWRLLEVDCRPDMGVCTAKYRRTRLADNHTLSAALPDSWKIAHADLETASASWQLPANFAAYPLKLRDMPSPESIRTIWEPSWQALRPALQDFTLAPAARASVSVPNVKLSNGLEQPVPVPKGITLPASRGLVINAPLRSLYGLVLPPTSEISQLQLRYMPDVTPGLNVSAFSATLKGIIYVQSP